MSVAEEVKVQPPSLDVPEVAHIGRKSDITRAYVTGEEIEALCGERFVPSRDPDQYPVCSPCKTEYERIVNAR